MHKDLNKFLLDIGIFQNLFILILCCIKEALFKNPFGYGIHNYKNIEKSLIKK